MNRKLFNIIGYLCICLLLFGVPWWTLLGPGNDWPLAVVLIGSLVFVAGLVGLPLSMVRGHGRHDDRAARIGDTLLGVVWVLFVWSIIGQALTGIGAAGENEARQLDQA